MRTKHLVALTGGLLIAIHTADCQPAKSTPSKQTRKAAPAEAQGFSGRVVEAMNATSYTYVLVDTGSKKIWAAAPQFNVKAGDTVTVFDGMPMSDYHSKTLNRNFELVYFTGGIAVNGKPPAAVGQEGKLPEGHPPIGSQAAPPRIDLSGIQKASGGSTVQEIFATKAKLSGKQVKIRGKVVKYNAMIMGKNWLHIQDGTGTEGSNDLIVTTSKEVKVGDTVLVTGTVLTDKDFGYGYKYSVLVDDAKVVIE